MRRDAYILTELIYAIYTFLSHFCSVLLVTVLALDYFANYHNLLEALTAGLIYGVVVSVTMTVMYYCIRKQRFGLMIAPLTVLFFLVTVCLDLTNFMTDNKPLVNRSFHVPVFVLTLPRNTCRNEYIVGHLRSHGIHNPQLLTGLDSTKDPTGLLAQDPLRYTGELTWTEIPRTVNTVMLASWIKVITEAYQATEGSTEKWFVVLENDAKLTHDFTYQLGPTLTRAAEADMDVVWLYKPIHFYYRTLGLIPCCMVGMAFRRTSVPLLLYKYNYPFLDRMNLLPDPKKPQPSDLLLAGLCQQQHLHCTVAPLVRESALGYPRTH